MRAMIASMPSGGALAGSGGVGSLTADSHCDSSFTPLVPMV